LDGSWNVLNAKKQPIKTPQKPKSISEFKGSILQAVDERTTYQTDLSSFKTSTLTGSSIRYS